MFRTTIIKEWQGVAYMMIDTGFPITDAMQDAMDECRFQQVLNLLSKNQDNEAQIVFLTLLYECTHYQWHQRPRLHQILRTLQNLVLMSDSL